MADFANMNVSTDNEVSVYDTPDTTLVIDGSFEDSLNMNTSLIQSEKGIPHPKKPVSINLDNSAALSIGEPSLYDNASFSSTRSQSTIRDSPDGASSLGDGEDLASDATDVGSDLDTSVSDKPPSAYVSPTKADVDSDIVTGKPDETKNSDGSRREGEWRDEYTGQTFPDTVTRLPSPDGAQVYLVGTVHFSSTSCDDVSKVIQAVRPHIVFVELCPSRYFYLHLDEATLLAETKNLNFNKVMQLIRTNGPLGGLFFAFLHSYSAKIAEQVGTAPGLEFRRAATEASKIPGCMIHLGDRPLGVTLRRVIAAIPWWNLVKLVFELLKESNSDITQEEMEEMKKHDILDDLMGEMAEKLPAVRHVFLDERDTYMAHSLQLAAMQDQVDERKHPVPCRVVGVVGIGHMKGMIEKWGKVSSAEVIPISLVPEPTMTTRVLRLTVRASFWGLVIYGVTRISPIRRNLPTLSGIATLATSATNYFRR